MAINCDGTLLAMGCSEDIKVFDLTETADGKPTLTLKYSILHNMGDANFGMAFDVADNVYMASASKGLGAWALPKQDNSFETPAPSTSTLNGKPAGGLVGDVTFDGKVDVSDVNAVINMVLGKVESIPEADVNADSKIDISDVNAIINIMLGKV